jgi:hypothetical protein
MFHYMNMNYIMHADSYGTGNCHLTFFDYNVCLYLFFCELNFHSVMVSFVKKLKCITQLAEKRHSLVLEFSNGILPALKFSSSLFHIFVCLQRCVLHL